MTALKRLRTAHGLTQAELAHEIGVLKTELSKWERGWEEIPTVVVKDLALFFDCTAVEVLGREIDVESEQWSTPFAVSPIDAPYGTLRLSLAGNRNLAFPIGQAARAAILRQLDRQGASRENNEPRPWIEASTLDNRILFINPRAIRRITLISDEAEPMPDFEHPEVYRTLEDWETLQDHDLGTKLREACERELERGGLPEPGGHCWHMQILWVDGSVEWVPLIEEGDVSGLFSLSLNSFDVPASALIQTKCEGYHKAGYINLDRTALLSVPFERFARLTAPQPQMPGDDDDGGDEFDGTSPHGGAVNDNRVGTVKG